MALDRDTVVSTAIRLINEDGLEALTLRKLAAELGVQAPALYWHVRNKRQLLDLVAIELASRQRAFQPAGPAEGQAWWDWLLDGGRLLRETLLTQRDSALIAAGNRPTVDSLPGVESRLAALADASGLTPAEALLFILASGNYAVGSVLETQMSANRYTGNDEESESADRAVFAEMIDAARFPTLAAAAGGLAGITDPAELETLRQDLAAGGQPEGMPASSLDDAVFAFGAELMIEGLRARVARRAAGHQND